MSHNVTSRDGLFTVREPAWHGLGTVLDDYPSRAQAKEIAHPWEPITEPLYRVVSIPVHDEWASCEDPDGCENERHWKSKSQAVRVKDFDLVVRDDDHGVIGVKPESRSLVTNDELYDIADALQGEGSEVKYETGGSLKGGRKVWLLLRFNEPIQIAGRHGTETIPYYALQNAHDGTGALRGQATFVCIVCDNTATWADLDAQDRGTEFIFRHTSNIHERIEAAKEALAGWKENVTEYNRLSEHLIDLPITKEQRTLFVHEFIPLPQETLISDRVRANVAEGRTKLFDIFDSATQESIRDTAFGLLQGAIEYSQWYRKARSHESRFQRAYLDRSRLTTDALTLAQSVAKQ